ncbi:hypothetical protein [Streptomyces sp. NPDC007984]|uniref:hypothetical protein n=1 Tax=Streptomyces sp. NPDC007984 TaxID=3364801 RepID=UPI0036F02E4E
MRLSLIAWTTTAAASLGLLYAPPAAAQVRCADSAQDFIEAAVPGQDPTFTIASPVSDRSSGIDAVRFLPDGQMEVTPQPTWQVVGAEWAFDEPGGPTASYSGTLNFITVITDGDQVVSTVWGVENPVCEPESSRVVQLRGTRTTEVDERRAFPAAYSASR